MNLWDLFTNFISFLCSSASAPNLPAKTTSQWCNRQCLKWADLRRQSLLKRSFCWWFNLEVAAHCTAGVTPQMTSCPDNPRLHPGPIWKRQQLPAKQDHSLNMRNCLKYCLVDKAWPGCNLPFKLMITMTICLLTLLPPLTHRKWGNAPSFVVGERGKMPAPLT